MYKTNAETEERRASLITVEMNDKKDNVEIYVRNAVNCKIHREAAIELPTRAFVDLAVPILQAVGFVYAAAPEEI